MEYTTLGKTGLRISVAGLGCGGPSRLGMRNDPQSEKNAIGIIKQALELGVNFLDTAQTYGTEPVVGKAISGVPRTSLVISTFPICQCMPVDCRSCTCSRYIPRL